MYVYAQLMGTGNLQITGPGSVVLYEDSFSSAEQFSGNWNVQSSGTLRVRNVGNGDSAFAMGKGNTANVASGSELQFEDTGSNQWAFRFTATGNGTIRMLDGNDTLKVQRNNSDTAGGFSPGNSAGIFNVVGNVDFQLSDDELFLPDFTVEVTGGNQVAGIDFDRLAVVGSVSNVDNLNLIVDIDPSLFDPDLTGDFLPVLTSTVTDFTGQVFASVTNLNNDWTFDVLYQNNQIVLTNFIGPEEQNNGGGAVPEPSTFALALLSLAGLAWYGWRARKSRR
jgi:hypothetical protein